MKKTINLFAGLMGCLTILCGQAVTAATQEPQPAAKQSGWLYEHRVKIEVEVPNAAHPDPDGWQPKGYSHAEFFGNRIADIIAIRVRIWVVSDPTNGRKVAVDFSSLTSGRLTVNADDDPDWVLADPIALAPGDAPLVMRESNSSVLDAAGNKVAAQLYEFRMFVQTKRQPVPTNFWLEFQAASELTPNGVLDWQKATTPDFYLTMSPTADKACKDMSMGNTSLEPDAPPVVPGTILIVCGGLLLLLPISAMAIRLIRHLCLRAEDLDPEERFWSVLHEALERTRVPAGYAMTKADVQKIVSAFKEVFGIGTLTVADVVRQQYEIDHGTELRQVLEALEQGVLEQDQELSPEGYRATIAKIEQLVPRP